MSVKNDCSRINLGSRAKIEFQDTGKIETIEIVEERMVSTDEAQSEKGVLKISFSSPFAKAAMNAGPGEKVFYEVASRETGKMEKIVVKILDVKNK